MPVSEPACPKGIRSTMESLYPQFAKTFSVKGLAFETKGLAFETLEH